MVKEIMLEDSARVLGGYCSPIMFSVGEGQKPSSLVPQVMPTKTGTLNLGSVSPVKIPIHMPVLPICPNRYQ